MANKHAKRKRQLKLIIFGIIIAIIAVIAITIIIGINKKKNEQKNQTNEESYIQEMEDGISINKSLKLNEAKLVNGLLVSNIQLTEKDGMTTLLADVTNKTEQKTEFKKLKIILLDENENEIATMTAFVNSIEVGETTQLNASTTSNYIKAYDFKIVED